MKVVVNTHVGWKFLQECKSIAMVWDITLKYSDKIINKSVFVILIRQRRQRT